jgi:hypothetical protein
MLDVWGFYPLELGNTPCMFAGIALMHEKCLAKLGFKKGREIAKVFLTNKPSGYGENAIRR